MTLTVAQAGQGQISPNGSQFQVNSYTTSDQEVPALAAGGQGRYVVAWTSNGSSGTDTDIWSIQAQRYDGTGANLGSQFQVNTFTASYQVNPAVAMNSQGGFIVAWQSSGSDSSLTGIQAQLYDANGDPVGNEVQVNAFTTNYQRSPAVAMDSLGNFIVTWYSMGSGGTDSSDYSIQAQRYDGSGAAVGAQFQVNTYTTGGQKAPAVAMDGQSGFVIAWESTASGESDTSSYSIHAQRFDSSGAALGGQFQVNSYTTGSQRLPSIAADAGGGFVIVWWSSGSGGTDSSGESIQAQRFDANGVPQGSEFQVNTYTTANQSFPVVAADSQGYFVVAWQGGSTGTDTGAAVKAQRYDPSGAALGGEFQVNSYTTGTQQAAAVGVDDTGNFVLAWTSAGSGGTDSSSTSVQAQRYDGLFRDGFESSDTSRWSSTVSPP